VAESPNMSSRIGGFLKKKPFYLMDTGIAAEHFCLQAAEEGLGTCMIGWFDEQRVKRLLEVPGKKGIALLITLGYPAREGAAPRKSRKPLEEMLSWGVYGRKS
jgi:nitroreductase